MKLTQEQFKEILTNEMTEPNGLSRLMSLIIEIAMDGERELYKEASGDVSNGYRPRRIFASGNMLELRVPRTRQRGFMPLILGLLKDQEKEMASWQGICIAVGIQWKISLEFLSGSMVNDIVRAKSIVFLYQHKKPLKRGVIDNSQEHLRHL